MPRSFVGAVAILVLATVVLAAEGDGRAPDLAAPVRITVDGAPIDVEIGHAAPYVCDWDRDGRPDLLVGQFGGGKLRIFPNVGEGPEPVLGAPLLFTAGGAEGTIPSG